jgi:hypothetical protein
MPPREELELSRSQIADLSALADGTIDPSRRAAVEAWIATDPRLGDTYETERSLVERLHEVRAEGRAPTALRARIEADRSARRARPRVRIAYAAALGTAAAALAVALGLTLPGGAPGSPSVSQAAALAQRGPAQPAPGPNPRYPKARLAQDVQEVYFPNWERSFGWQAVGQRTDRLGQRVAVTVYYARGSQQVAYTIVGGGALPEPGGQVSLLNRYRLDTLTSGGRTIVTWRRKGRTCVLSASGVSPQVLQHLAAWRPGTITE